MAMQPHELEDFDRSRPHTARDIIRRGLDDLTMHASESSRHQPHWPLTSRPSGPNERISRPSGPGEPLFAGLDIHSPSRPEHQKYDSFEKSESPESVLIGPSLPRDSSVHLASGEQNGPWMRSDQSSERGSQLHSGEEINADGLYWRPLSPEEAQQFEVGDQAFFQCEQVDGIRGPEELWDVMYDPESEYPYYLHVRFRRECVEW